MLSFGGCLQESKLILRYVLDECLNVWINDDWENLRLYNNSTTCRIKPQKTTTKLKFLSPWKPVNLFWIMSGQRDSILLWKYLLAKEEEFIYWWKVSKFLLPALFANARRVDVSKFRVKNKAILRLRSRKQLFFLFSKIKGFSRKQLTSDCLPT